MLLARGAARSCRLRARVCQRALLAVMSSAHHPHHGDGPFAVSERPKDHRKNVGVVLLNRRNEVFLAKRAPGEGGSGATLWQFAQGGVDKGEDCLAAARRELQEETGVTSAQLVTEMPVWLCYQFPPDQLARWVAEGKGWNGKYAGQAQRWFFFRFTGDDSEVNLQAHEGHAPEFAEWRWAAFDEALLEEVVPFKRRVYEAVLRHFRETVAPATPAL